MNSQLRLLLVEDDELFRLGLATRLRQEKDVLSLREAGDGETALEMVQSQSLDGVILDIGLPGLGGLETCHQIKMAQPQLPILILTSHARPALISQLIQLGVSGYCLKGIPSESLLLAIRSVMAGASWWDSVATDVLRQRLMGRLPPLESFGLTPREQEILELMGQGKTNQEIAHTFYISPGTVRVHVHAILQKLGVRDRTQAALVVLQQTKVQPNL
ncbi:MAG: response regulator transcription factor [Cyanobacteriota bacterium]|nr:response regulator transcription factor [Cyanobacteriota bacterium]